MHDKLAFYHRGAPNSCNCFMLCTQVCGGLRTHTSLSVLPGISSVSSDGGSRNSMSHKLSLWLPRSPFPVKRSNLQPCLKHLIPAPRSSISKTLPCFNGNAEWGHCWRKVSLHSEKGLVVSIGQTLSIACRNPLYLNTSTWSLRSEKRFPRDFSGSSVLGILSVLHPDKTRQPFSSWPMSRKADTGPTKCQSSGLFCSFEISIVHAWSVMLFLYVIGY